MADVELREFVKQTLEAIIAGIKDAQSIEAVGAYVGPDQEGSAGLNFPDNRGVGRAARALTTVVEFDVAISAEAANNKSRGAGIRIGVVSAGMGRKAEQRDSSNSRVKFSVPIIIPKSPKNLFTPE